jgi:hypothetical protein
MAVNEFRWFVLGLTCGGLLSMLGFVVAAIVITSPRWQRPAPAQETER